MAVTTTLADLELNVIGGVDTHKDIHVAAVIDELGRLLATKSFRTTRGGYGELLKWMKSFGQVLKIGVEGTGSWGAGLSRFLQSADVQVVEVNCPNRQHRRLKGKSDTTDAEAAARAALSNQATAKPKTGDGAVESIRILRIVRRSTVQSRTQIANQIHSIIDTAPDQLRAQLRGMTMLSVCKLISRFRPDSDLTNPTTSSKVALRTLGLRWLTLREELTDLDRKLRSLVEQSAPTGFLEATGVGTDTAGALLVAAGDNPERCFSEAGFAALCGVSPVDASSGRRQRHRLNRGGNRDANNALWRIVMVRLSCDPSTREYMDKRCSQGKTKKEAIRCLKRSVARQMWRLLVAPNQRTKIVREAA